MIRIARTDLGTFVLLAALCNVTHAADLCKPDEKVVFSCELKESKKNVSICTSNVISRNVGYIQYRYGTPEKLELSFPENLATSRNVFGYDEYSRPDLSTFIVGFTNGNYRYEIFETLEGGDEGIATRALLVSSKKRKRTTRLTCVDNGSAVSSLSTLDQILKCDKEHEIIAGSCD